MPKIQVHHVSVDCSTSNEELDMGKFDLMQWAYRIRERMVSGQSVTEFCETIGVSQNVYYHKRRMAIKAGFLCVPIRTRSPRKLSKPIGSSTLLLEVGNVKITTDSTCSADVLAALLSKLPKVS